MGKCLTGRWERFIFKQSAVFVSNGWCHVVVLPRPWDWYLEHRLDTRTSILNQFIEFDGILGTAFGGHGHLRKYEVLV